MGDDGGHGDFGGGFDGGEGGVEGFGGEGGVCGAEDEGELVDEDEGGLGGEVGCCVCGEEGEEGVEEGGEGWFAKEESVLVKVGLGWHMGMVGEGKGGEEGYVRREERLTPSTTPYIPLNPQPPSLVPLGRLRRCL